LAEVLLDTAAGRTSPQQLTIFESLGLAVEDLAAAACAYRKATSAGVGTRISF
jgi:ornithine cyclodeaminase